MNVYNFYVSVSKTIKIPKILCNWRISNSIKKYSMDMVFIEGGKSQSEAIMKVIEKLKQRLNSNS